MPDEPAASRAALDALHARLLEGDHVAPAELACLVLAPLERALARRTAHLLQASGRTVHLDEVHDAAVGAFMSYVKRPQQYDPRKAPRGLFPYLVMAAHRDLLNALPRIKRQRQVTPLSRVELGGHERNIRMIPVGGAPATRGGQEDRRVVDEQTLAARLALMETDAERAVLRHMELGERRTEVFAADLGIAALPPGEQRRRVKQAKDRIKKRLERAGLRPRAPGGARA